MAARSSLQHRANYSEFRFDWKVVMRRGLMGWDEAELPRSVLEARLERLQAAMAREGLDALLLYTNLVRPAAVCWLTGFTPYWIESLLLVLRSGPPMLATALS